MGIIKMKFNMFDKLGEFRQACSMKVDLLDSRNIKTISCKMALFNLYYTTYLRHTLLL